MIGDSGHRAAHLDRAAQRCHRPSTCLNDSSTRDWLALCQSLHLAPHGAREAKSSFHSARRPVSAMRSATLHRLTSRSRSNITRHGARPRGSVRPACHSPHNPTSWPRAFWFEKTRNRRPANVFSLGRSAPLTSKKSSSGTISRRGWSPATRGRQLSLPPSRGSERCRQPRERSRPREPARWRPTGASTACFANCSCRAASLGPMRSPCRARPGNRSFDGPPPPARFRES